MGGVNPLNSTFDMLETAFEIRKAIDSISQSMER